MQGATTEAADLPSPAKAAGHAYGGVGPGSERCGDAVEVGRPVADHAELFGMDAAGDQHAVETGAGRAGDVGTQAVANGKNRSEEHTSELQSRLQLVCR